MGTHHDLPLTPPPYSRASYLTAGYQIKHLSDLETDKTRASITARYDFSSTMALLRETKEPGTKGSGPRRRRHRKKPRALIGLASLEILPDRARVALRERHRVRQGQRK